jgi:uncharacterized protein YgbK (DUF1537 family)
MIAILADDFSGAAELAGIAAARGLKAEAQTAFDPDSDAEVIAVDTDTRLQREDEAARVVRDIALRVAAAKPAWIYKKTDSVLRGHIRREIEAILDAGGLTECVFIPANPSKGRIIREGHYFVDGEPLHETIFAADPDHPRRSSLVRDLLGESTRIHTPDANTLDDLRLRLPANVLAAGAADFFAARLDWHLESVSRFPHPPLHSGQEPKRTLLLCGSLAAWETGRAFQMRDRGFVVKTLNDAVSPSLWLETNKLMLAIGKPGMRATAALSEALVEKALPLLVEPQHLRIGLEGGATAMAFIRRMGWTRFEVLPEGHTGVGTLRPPGGPVLCVKPGSYPWPEGCL